MARKPWGAEQSLLLLANGLVEQGHRCLLLCVSPELEDRWVADGLGEVRLIEASPDEDRRRDLAIVVREARRLPASDALVIFSYQMLFAAWLLRWRRPYRSTVFVADLHDNLGGRKGRALQQLAVLGCDSVVAVSRYTASQVRHRAISVIYRPVPVATPRDQPRAQHVPLNVGVLGRVDPMKNHGLVVRALRGAHHPMRLVIRGAPAYGETAYLDSLHALVAAERIEASFDGRVPPEAALADLDVLVVANADEPMGRTVAEAQMAGVPVVVPDRGGSAELVDPGVTGLRYTANSPGALAGALDRLVEDPALAESLRRSALEMAAVRYDPAGYARAYAQSIFGPSTNLKHKA